MLPRKTEMRRLSSACTRPHATRAASRVVASEHLRGQIADPVGAFTVQKLDLRRLVGVAVGLALGYCVVTTATAPATPEWVGDVKAWFFRPVERTVPEGNFTTRWNRGGLEPRLPERRAP